MRKIIDFFTEEIEVEPVKEKKIQPKTNKKSVYDQDASYSSSLYTEQVKQKEDTSVKITNEEEKREKKVYDDTRFSKDLGNDFVKDIFSNTKKEEPVKEVTKTETKPKYKPTPFISPVYGIVNKEENEKFFEENSKSNLKRIEEVTNTFNSKIDEYEKVRSKAFSTLTKIQIESDEINVLEDVDFDDDNTDVDKDGKYFFDLNEKSKSSTKGNYLFTTQEILGVDYGKTTIEDANKSYISDGVEYNVNSNQEYVQYDDELDKLNLLNLIDEFDDTEK